MRRSVWEAGLQCELLEEAAGSWPAPISQETAATKGRCDLTAPHVQLG